jgi:hypothetical protein
MQSIGDFRGWRQARPGAGKVRPELMTQVTSYPTTGTGRWFVSRVRVRCIRLVTSS